MAGSVDVLAWLAAITFGWASSSSRGILNTSEWYAYAQRAISPRIVAKSKAGIADKTGGIGRFGSEGKRESMPSVVPDTGRQTSMRLRSWIGFALVAIILVAADAPSVLADDGAELAQLRQKLAEKDQVIEQLKAQLASQSITPEVIDPLPATPTLAPPVTPSGTGLPPLILDDEEESIKRPSLFDNFSVFAGFDGSKQPQDFGLNALFGGRYQFDWGIPLLKEYGLGLQVGSALNVSSNAVQVFDRVQGTKSRLQNFTTVGIYQRTDQGFNWGIGYDLLYEQYFGHFHLGQWRGKFGYEWDERNEVGINLMLRSYGANGTFNKIRVGLEPIDMATLFYRHTWSSGVGTTVWAGLADGHNEANAVLGDAGRVSHPFVYGAQIDAPLSERFTLFGQANFITPPSTGTVDAFLGITFHPVERSTRARSEKFRPVMAIANNPTFAVDLGRRK